MAGTRQRDSSSSDSESVELVVRHALSASVGMHESMIVDSEAECHMCNDRRLFVELCNLEKPLEVTLGDGHALDAIGRGVVVLETNLPSGRTKKCKLHDVLYVPKLSYNLLSVSRISDAGKTTRFGEASFQILDENRKLIGVAEKAKTPEQNGVAEKMNQMLVETTRSMLAYSKLPPKFWAEALSTAVYLENRSPTKSVEGMTPFEAWMGEKTNIEHLRTFRMCCLCPCSQR